MNFNRITVWIAVILGIFLLAAGIWFFFFRQTATVSTDGTASNSLFGGSPNAANTTPAKTDTNGTQVINTTASAVAQKIFKISDGPVVGATLLQTVRPTTTIARYIRQDDGHVFDVPLGVAGAVPRVVSNITIPGGQRAIWLEGGNAALMQYVDDSGVVKTVYLGFPQATTTRSALPTRIQFLPDNIIDIAGAPDGKNVTYLIKTAGGSDGYIARSDGTNSKKTFSLPLSQMLISWPSQDTILVTTKAAAGVPGMAFYVDAKSGAATQLVTAPGLSVTGNGGFTRVIYQISQNDSSTSYVYDVKTALSTLLTPTVMPEKCIWGSMASAKVYCAAPLSHPAGNYLDLWHAGTASSADDLFAVNVNTGISTLVAIPGSTGGGVLSDILEMALSPDERYLSYTVKGSRTLWGVLLSN